MNRKALHKISYGLYIICSKKDKKINGQIANAVFQVTSDPPTVAVSINKKNLTHEFIESSKVFTMSILCEKAPMTYIGTFGYKSGRDIDKFKEDLDKFMAKWALNGKTENEDMTVYYNDSVQVVVGISVSLPKGD